jgi:hypothetical protein
MFSEIVALISVLIAGLAMFITIKQNALNRKTMQAQTFVTIVNTAREINTQWTI